MDYNQESKALSQASKVLEESDERFYKFMTLEKPTDKKAQDFVKVMDLPNCSEDHFRHRGGHIFHLTRCPLETIGADCETEWKGYHCAMATGLDIQSGTRQLFDIHFAPCDPNTVSCEKNKYFVMTTQPPQRRLDVNRF